MITFCGKEIEAAGKTLSTLLMEQNFERDRVAVEVDYEIISKKDWDSFIVPDQCVIEVVSFVGGG